jgi:hypothetical protein
VREERRYRGPVVSRRDLRVGRFGGDQIVAPGPAAELRLSVAREVVAGLPGDRSRRIEHGYTLGHLVAAVWLLGSAKTVNTASAGAAMMVRARHVSNVMS